MENKDSARNDESYFRQPEAGEQQQPKEGSNTEDVKVESHTKGTHTKTSTDKTKKETEEHNEVWSNQVQFILTAVGLAVGLGNVWKFPYLAYAHGGAAFLIPYIFFGVTFGLPVLYIEFLMGQYSRSNPAKAFYRYAPAFQGVGLLTALLDFLIGAFYALVIAWAELYLVYIVMGQSWKWTTCGNWWNNENCISTDSHNFCRQKNSSFPYAMVNGTCTSAQPAKNIENGAQQFFGRYIFVASTGIGTFGEINYPVIGCVVFFYILCALTLWKGIRILEMTSYVTVPLPYVVILIFFFRAIFLDGSWDGIKLYLFQPDFSKLLGYEPWVDALKQICFSLTIGCGALISLASHNKVSNNCFRDAVIVTVCDTMMSLIGGVAVFGTLGYLAKRTGRTVAEVVVGGPPLIFISYPEATATMPVPWLWNALFFLMVFMLGFSSMIAIIEAMSNFALSSFSLENSKKSKIIIPCAISAALAAIGSLLATGAGSYWFHLMADFVATTAPCAAGCLEIVLIAYVYRWSNLKDDMEEMWGEPPQSVCGRLWSRFSPFFKWSWLTVTPALAIVGIGITLYRDPIPAELGGITAPIWAEVVGWFLNLGPVLAVPIYFLINICLFKKKNIALKYLFMPSKGLPAHDRYYKKKGIPPPNGWAKEETSVSSAGTHTEPSAPDSI